MLLEMGKGIGTMISFIKSFGKSTVVAVLIFVLYSCAIGNIRVNRQHDNTDKRVTVYAEYVGRLSKDLKLNDKITIGLVDEIKIPFIDNIIGRCAYVVGKGWEIDILKESYDGLTHFGRLFLIAHELRHCACKDFGHIVSKPKNDSNRCSSHYFNSSHMGNKCAKIHAKEYLEQIKRGCE